MNRTGQEAQSLTVRLRNQTTDRRKAESAAISKELTQLADDLRRTSQSALNGFEGDFLRNLSKTQRIASQRLSAMNSDLSAIRSRPTLMIALSALIGGLTATLIWAAPTIWTALQPSEIKIETTTQGRFLILPTTAQTGWRCGETPCVKLED